MWNWFRSWFVNESWDVYAPKERILYRYFDGEKLVRADPQVIYRSLMDIAPELSIDINVSNSPSKDWKKATLAADRKIRELFGIKAVTEGGLTEPELYDLLYHFYRYCEHIKKGSSPLPTSLPKAGGSIPSSEASAPITSNSSVSGSTAAASSSAAPEPSVSESASPLVSSIPDQNTGKP